MWQECTTDVTQDSEEETNARFTELAAHSYGHGETCGKWPLVDQSFSEANHHVCLHLVWVAPLRTETSTIQQCGRLLRCSVHKHPVIVTKYPTLGIGYSREDDLETNTRALLVANESNMGIQCVDWMIFTSIEAGNTLPATQQPAMATVATLHWVSICIAPTTPRAVRRRNSSPHTNPMGRRNSTTRQRVALQCVCTLQPCVSSMAEPKNTLPHELKPHSLQGSNLSYFSGVSAHTSRYLSVHIFQVPTATPQHAPPFPVSEDDRSLRT